MSRDSQAPLTIFCSYAPEDENLYTKMVKHLSLLQREEVIETWSNRMLAPGMDWAQEIDARLNSASIILLLISPDFMASDYCYGSEMMRALERDRLNSARVLLVLLRPVDWAGAPFAHLKCLPANNKPITTWLNEDEAFEAVAKEIRTVVKQSRPTVISTSKPHIPVLASNSLYKYDAHTNQVFTAAWSHDGSYIASGGSGGDVHVWSASDGHHLLTYRGHSNRFPLSSVFIVRWSPNDLRIASAGFNSSIIHVWDAMSGQRTLAYEGHSNALPAIYHLAWSPDGNFIASTNMAFFDEAVHIWDASNGRRLQRINLRLKSLRSSSAGDVSWSSDGERIAASWERKVRIYHAQTGNHILTYEHPRGWVARVVWSPNCQYIASVTNHGVHVWTPTTCTTIFVYSAHTGLIRAIAWSPDSRYIATASEDKTVQIWEATTGKQLYVYSGHTHHVISVAWSPDGLRIASASADRTVHLWQVPPFIRA